MSKKKTRFKVKVSLLMSGVLLLMCLGVANMTAYLADGDRAVNKLKVGSNVIDIVEEFEAPEELEPGVEIPKDVKVTNTGKSDCYVRVLAVFSNSDMGDYCTVDWNKTDWVYNTEDGYWYYKKAVASGEATTSLLTTVTLSNEITADQIKGFEIIVYAESYQAAGFADYEAAWENYQKNRPET